SFIWHLVEKPEVSGTYHWTDSGVASWYDFAVAVLEEALQGNLLNKPIPIIPVMTSDYPTPARRPL
ncbi:MAG: sugar nucleotide-binding protein, partial [Candidatus Aminicenantes bacterium]|nr:sugar nucleotide-binding protein [Candidatus Aminicenantes bacterium]